MTKEEMLDTLSKYQEIRVKLTTIAQNLYENSFGDSDYKTLFDLENESVDVSWEERACSRGCCGYETREESFPISYLWTENYLELYKAKLAEEEWVKLQQMEQRKRERDLEREVKIIQKDIRKLTANFDMAELGRLRNPSEENKRVLESSKESLVLAEEALKALLKKYGTI